jgi:hypothetical protein
MPVPAARPAWRPERHGTCHSCHSDGTTSHGICVMTRLTQLPMPRAGASGVETLKPGTDGDRPARADHDHGRPHGASQSRPG